VSAAPRHFLGLDQLEPADLRHLIEAGRALKRSGRRRPDPRAPLAGRILMLLFEKPSTRTRVSFEVAMRQLGGEVIVLNAGDSQLGRGETPADTARVLSRYVDAVMVRALRHATLGSLAAHAEVPVINGLTDETHPCQLLADVMTFEEARGPIGGRTVAWLGDGNNVAATWVQAAAQFGFTLRLGLPAGARSPDAALAWARARGASIALCARPEAAVEGADAVVTDTWLSMGDPPSKDLGPFRPFQVGERLMALAGREAVFLHCLPATRGQEVTDAVIDGPASLVWDEAENRVHAQKAVLLYCLAPEALP
jgi:ornithine carbamoyltransferase